MKEAGLHRIRELLLFIYGDETGGEFYSRLLPVLEQGPQGRGMRPFSCQDAMLISYGDMLSPPENEDESVSGETGLSRLRRFLSERNQGAFSCLHILPFHPYSSDDGFSVIDYREVDERFGTWEDIEELGTLLDPVFDFVLNHGSVQSDWFKGFLGGDEKYRHWYITRPKDYDYSAVVRPRTHPLLTPFPMKDGSLEYVWTTFSADQADYDFSNPQVLLEFVKIFLEYARRGARILRLDAIAYLWKEDGTSCLHLPKTHAVVKLFRAIIETLNLDMRILTETNVPHGQNISYFGDGDEAHMVYNFALPPLVLYGAISGDAGPLREWARSLPPPRSDRIFLNFLASHDGVGLTPAKGLVDDAAFAAAIEEARRRGALVSYKAVPGGEIPYELNCSYAGVAAPPSLGPPELRARAFLATQAVLLALSGLPGVYFHSWIGSEAWEDGPEILGYKRAINREKPPIDLVEDELDDPSSFRSRVYRGFERLLAFRGKEAAFDPAAPQQLVPSEKSLFVLLRGPDAEGRRVLCIQNLGPERMTLSYSDMADIPAEPWETKWIAFGGGREKSELSTAEWEGSYADYR
ncbi:sugar phosphorylase [Treponema sp. OttesenSCG-928-L16]|nr:sugar phosphorylase [Treponema sp. OttesenSCG-928-L16]